MWGLIYYPKCKRGYSAFGCCICRPSYVNCLGFGPQLDLSCRKQIGNCSWFISKINYLWGELIKYYSLYTKDK